MYDLDKDIENVAKAVYTERNGRWNYSTWGSDSRIAEAYRKDARAALNASDAVKQLKQAEERIKELEADVEHLGRVVETYKITDRTDRCFY